MRALCFLTSAVAWLLMPACSSGSNADGTPAGTGSGVADDSLIVPDGIGVMALEGGAGVLDLQALTLRDGPKGLEAYVALKNDGDIAACAAGVSLELYDKAQQKLGAGISSLLSSHYYRLTDGSGTITSCVGPGDLTMAVVTDFQSDATSGDVGFVVYQCPYFALGVELIDGLTLSKVTSIPGSGGTAYAGTLLNGFDVAVTNPIVTVFPTNRGGRPLGVATASGSDDLPPRGSWPFETSAVDAPGVGQVAYPGGTLAN
jgi:hypothetical protein